MEGLVSGLKTAGAGLAAGIATLVVSPAVGAKKGGVGGENHTRNEWERCENHTRNEWERCESTLKTSGKMLKLHSKRVGRCENYTRN